MALKPQQKLSHKCGTIAFVALACLVLVANAEGASESSGSTGYPVDNDMMELLLEETSGARASAQAANELDDLKTAVASKVKAADDANAKKTSALNAKLAKDKEVLKAAKKEVKDKAPKDAVNAATDKNAAAAVAGASSEQAAVGPRLLHTIVKLQQKLKSVVADSEKKTAKKVEEVKTQYEAKLKAATEKLLLQQKDTKHMVHKVAKQSAKKTAARQDLASMRKRKDARKDQLQKAQELIKQLDAAVHKFHAKAAGEKKLRVKAVQSAVVLGDRIKKMSEFGKKASHFAKKQAVKAAQAKAHAKDVVNKIQEEKAKADKETVRLKVMREEVKKELDQVKAEKVAEKAKRLHEVAKRRELAKQLGKVQTLMQKEKDHTAEALKRMQKHKDGEQGWVKKAKGLKVQAQKAALALKKVDTIRQALVQAKMDVEHYKHENQVQRMELTTAAKTQLEAAAVTKKAAANAGAIQERAMMERNLYKKIVAKAKLQMEKEHAERMRLQNSEGALVQQSKTQLVQEHSLRVNAEASIAKKVAAARSAKAAVNKEHESRLKLKAENEELKSLRDQLLEREKAAARMIAVEQEATQEAKAAALSVKKTEEAKISKLKDSYTSLLKQANDKASLVKMQAATVMEKSQGLKDAIKKEKEVLLEEQTKTQKERASWKQAVAAMDKERIARDVAKAKAESSKRDIAKTATLEVGKAAAIAKTKSLLLDEVKRDMQAQAKKFEGASKDWSEIKLGLEQRAEKAEQAAADANAKLSLYMSKRHEDSATTVATSAVDNAIQKAKDAAVTPAVQNKPSEVQLVQDDSVEPIAEDVLVSEVPPTLV